MPLPAAKAARPATTTAARRRKTVTLDFTRLQTLLQLAVQRALEQAAQAAPPWLELGAARRDAGGAADQLLALLKAFLDAARGAGGLPMDADGRPLHLVHLVAVGRDNAQAGDCRPKLLAKVRLGKPVDLRLAEAVLACLRYVLERPTLTLDDLGAVESHRLKAVQRVEAAIRAGLEELPASVYEGLALRAQEAAGYGVVLDDVVFEYRDFEPFVDVRGVQRLRAVRVQRYRPVRLTPYAGPLRPSRAFEWYEWTPIEHMQLRLWLLDADGHRSQAFEPALRKRMDDERGVVVWDIEPAAASAIAPHLQLPAAGGAPYTHEIEWRETMIFNVADRDIIVGYSPMNRPRVVFDAAAHPELTFKVGDSPGLRPTPDGWQLDRVLMAREVLAVRFRLARMNTEDAQRLSPSGEWLVPPAS
jgi:hypothetical protein